MRCFEKRRSGKGAVLTSWPFVCSREPLSFRILQKRKETCRNWPVLGAKKRPTNLSKIPKPSKKSTLKSGNENLHRYQRLHLFQKGPSTPHPFVRKRRGTVCSDRHDG